MARKVMGFTIGGRGFIVTALGLGALLGQLPIPYTQRPA